MEGCVASTAPPTGTRIVRTAATFLALIAASCVSLAAATGAPAYWTGTGSGGGIGTAGTLWAPGQPTRVGSGSTIALGWSAATPSGGGAVRYRVQRAADNEPITTWTDACDTNATSSIRSPSCTDSPAEGATYRYHVIAIDGSWTAEGPVSAGFPPGSATTTPH